jgi:LysR family transcriptional regulator, nitrogen assimilation regulatory protein
MDLRQIQYFLRAFEERSFTRAAEKANVVQPALSMQISRLEAELSTPLFVRTKKGLEPTAAGHRLYERCIPIARGVAAAKQDILDFAAGSRISQSFRVGMPPSIARGSAGTFLAKYLNDNPNIAVSVTEAYSADLTSLVRDGELDIALGAIPPADSGLAAWPAFKDSLVLVTGKPINGKSLTPCRLPKIDNLKLIVPAKSHLLNTLTLDFIAASGIQPARVLVVQGYVSTFELARSSDWAGIFPATSMVNEIETREDLYIYPVIQPALSYDLYFVHDPRHALTEAMRRFLSELELHLRGLSAIFEDMLKSTRRRRK